VVPPWPIPIPFRKLQWLFPVVVTAHNLEEAIWLPGFIAMHADQLPWAVRSGEFRLALVVLTVAAWVVTYLSWRTGKQTLWAYLEFGYVTAMLVNVFVPHVPSVFVFRRYVPGFGTAVILNLPVLTVLATKAVREGYVSGRKSLVFGIGVPVGLGAVIVALFAVVG
jgi:hypothetical protein